MKTILAATDFSPAGHNACVYAAALAKAFNAKLILFSAYQQIPFPAVEAPVIIPVEEIREQTKIRLAEEVKAVDPYEQLLIQTRYTEGPAGHQVMQAAVDAKADVIVVGMKASDIGFRKLLGSTVTVLTRITSIPVIVVRENTGFKRLDTIALATEGDAAPDADPHLLDTLRELGERFYSKLFLVRVAKDKFHEAWEVLNKPFRLTKMVRTLDPEFESISGRHVSEALNVFIEKYDVDMLVLLPHKHTLPERWFGKSITRSMVFNANIPLLILPDLHKEESNSEALKNRSSL